MKTETTERDFGSGYTVSEPEALLRVSVPVGLPPGTEAPASAVKPDLLPSEESSLPLVLLVEDNPGDVRIVREALSKAPIPLRLAIARDGLEGLRLLHGLGRKPDLILLDLNLPGMDGRSLLQRVKMDPALLRIPVIVVSGSDATWDVSSAYGLHANCYVVKPSDYQTFESTLGQLIEFWARTVRLPAH